MSALGRDFFTDPEILADPRPYYAALRERGPVFREPHRGVFMLSGIDEILELYADHERFSAIVGPLGPLVPIPKPEPGESLAELIERCRHEIPMGDQLTSLDPPKHTRHRALIGKLFTPNRLKENEEFMWTLAEGLIDELAGRGEMEFGPAYARPFTLLVIADLLGVPREHHETFRGWLGGQARQRRRSQGPARRRQRVREPAPLLHALHRGAPRRAARGRAEPAGQRTLPRRRAPAGDGRRAHRCHRLRRRAGDDGAPALRGHADPRRAARPRRRAAQRCRRDPELRRGVPAPRGPHQGLVPPRALATRSSRAWTSRRDRW